MEIGYSHIPRGLPIKSDGGGGGGGAQNVKGTKFCQKLYHRVR